MGAVGVALLSFAVLVALSFLPQSYALEMSGGRELGYIFGMHAVERNESFTYRWTSGSSTIRLPGVPGQNMLLTLKFAGPGLDVAPVREASLWSSKGLLHRFPVQPGLQEITLPIPADSVEDGELVLTLRVEPFSTSSDPRRLGMALVSLRLDPAGGVGELPWRYLALSSISVGLLVLMAVASGIGLGFSLFFGLVLVVGAALLQALDRPALGLFGWQAFRIAASGVALTALARAALGKWLWRHLGGAYREVSWAVFCTGMALMVLLLGVTYPQFATSDLMMHVHNLEAVLRGDLFFTELLPRGGPAPYPPAYYVLLVPFSLMYSDLPRLILVASSVLMASCVLLLWIASRAVLGTGWPGIVGGWLYAISPVSFSLISAGNHTNVFGQWVALLLFVYLAALQPKSLSERPLLLAGSAGLALLGFLSHLGVAQALLLCLGLYLLGLLLVPGPWRRRDAWILAAGTFVALMGAFLAYYVRFWSLMSNLGAYAASGEGVRAAGVPRRQIPIRLLGNLLSSAGTLPVLGGLWGAAASAWSRITTHTIVLMAAWAVGGLLYGVGNILTRTEGRNSLFVMAPLALGFGWLVVNWARRGWAGSLVSAGLLGAATWYGLYDWSLKVLYAYH